ncbi:MAG: hypothetical protein WC522_00435 [Candidatus Omnitrophota bacterium]
MIKTNFRIYVRGNLLRNSISAGIAKEVLEKNRSFEMNASEVYRNSVLCGAMRMSWKAFKEYSRQSFLGRLTEWRTDGFLDVADSRIAAWPTRFLRESGGRTAEYFEHSKVSSLTRRAKRSLCADPLKTVCAVGVAAILTNAVISPAIKSEIDLPGWITRAIFVLFGMTVISSGVSWDAAKRTSLFARFFTRYEKTPV